MSNFSHAEFRQIKIPDEHEICAGWTGAKPLVSILCTTYNHALYVEDAIRGFLIQKTDFPFEIIVHDDVSTDHTRTLIDRYAAAYPTIIRTVYQKENQYSRGAMILMLAARHATGDFIAFCEGDDYWIDPDKLQIQVDALKAHPDCELSFHPAVKTRQEIPGDALFCRRANGSRVLPIGPIIREGGSYMPTASMVIKKAFFERAFQDENPFYQRHMMGYSFQILCSLAGGALYIDRPMSVYRVFSEGSWTQTIAKDSSFYKKWLANYLDTLHGIDALTGYRYSRDILHTLRRCHLSVLNNKALEFDFRRAYVATHKKELGLWEILLWYGIFRIPSVHGFFIKVRALMQEHIKPKFQLFRRL
jgi:glycosyltransferase involved in cell wall biosynthesis